MNTSASNTIDWDKLVRLFTPGSGVEPPLLAGREAPLQKLADLIGYLQEDIKATPGEAVLYGPRGNGKTVLLNAFKRKQDGKDIDIVSLKGKQIRNETLLATYLLHQREVSMKDTENLKLDKGKVGFNLVSGELGKMSREDRDAYMTTHMVDLLTARCSNRPLLVVVDEAHTLDVHVGGLLLNASEAVRESGAPFLLALAGTPNLRAHLDLMSATFWDRAEIISVGRLDAAATRAALAEPLDAFRVTFEDDALERVVAETQHYPYFIQAWGKTLCLAMRDKKTMHVDEALVDAARPAFSERRIDYYEKRYEELRDHGLLESAKTVADMFLNARWLDDDELLNQLVAELSLSSEDARKAIKHISHLGFIWKPSGSPSTEPGIPSLMNYVLTERRQLTGERKQEATLDPDEPSLPKP